MPAVPRPAAHPTWTRRGSSMLLEQRLLIALGEARPYRAEEWENVLLIVERGRLELEWSAGTRAQFGPGDTLCLANLDLYALHATGPQPALLLALKRAPGLSHRGR
jgi:hypothetical protein